MNARDAKRDLSAILNNVRDHLNHRLAPGAGSVVDVPSLTTGALTAPMDARVMSFVSEAIAEKMERDLGRKVVGLPNLGDEAKRAFVTGASLRERSRSR